VANVLTNQVLTFGRLGHLGSELSRVPTVDGSELILLSPMLWAETVPERLVGHHVLMLCPPMSVYTVPAIALEDVPTLGTDPWTLYREILLAAAA
jgi:hypothetical protein